MAGRRDKTLIQPHSSMQSTPREGEGGKEGEGAFNIRRVGKDLKWFRKKEEIICMTKGRRKGDREYKFVQVGGQDLLCHGH